MRRALLDAALELIAEHGPHGFTMREAARLAGVSSGAPYRHFADRDALLAALAAEGNRKLRSSSEEAEKSVSGDSLEQFRAMGVAFVVFAVENPAYFRVMYMPEFAAAEGSPGADPALRSALAANREATEKIIASSQEEGVLYAADPQIIALAAQCLVYGLARMFVDGQLPRVGVGPEQAAKIARVLADVLGHGLRPRPGDGGSPGGPPVTPGTR